MKVLLLSLFVALVLFSLVTSSIFDKNSLEGDANTLKWYAGVVKEGLTVEKQLMNDSPTPSQPKNHEYDECIKISEEISNWIDEYIGNAEKIATLTFEIFEEKKKEMDECAKRMYKVTGEVPPEELLSYDEIDRQAEERKKNQGDAPKKCPLDAKEEL